MPLTSMTGFGSSTAVVDGEEISVELKSVNGKFCEVKARLPRELQALEQEVVRAVKDRLARGNVDLGARRAFSVGPQRVAQVDVVLLKAVAESLRTTAREAGLGETLELRDLLGISGLVTVAERPANVEASTRAMQDALGKAIEALISARKREGAALEKDLRGRVATMRGLYERLKELAASSTADFRTRLHERIAALAPDIALDPARLEQEVVIAADRADVTEELTRLAAHFDEMERLFDATEPVGRQLDFLLQELNREVNTTGSKSQNTGITRVIVEMKTELERLREQVQNVE